MTSFGDVELIAQWIRERISLPGYTSSAWPSSDLATVKEFVEDTSLPALFLTLENELLVVTTTAPREATDVMYFVKNGQTVVTPGNIMETLQFGCLDNKNAISSLLHLLNGFYVQRLEGTTSWPESVEKEFTGHFFRFMSSLTETVSRSYGKTVLYLPPLNLNTYKYKDKDFLQQLESTVIHWTRQIKEVLNTQDNTHETEDDGPLEEIQFWEHRTQDLSGITEQLNQPGVQAIVDILRTAKSSYLQPFETLAHIIQQGSMEANENLKFLQTLRPSCNELTTADPRDIPLLLPKLLNFIRLIWLYSSYYNTDERITSLLQKVSNELIRVCSRKISLVEILDGNVQQSIDHLEQSIACGVAWKQLYRQAASAVNATTSSSSLRRWQFDETGIFAPVDAFVQRCRELLEVCEGQRQFARKGDGGKRETLPLFGGNRGLEIVKSLRDIESQFERYVDRLRQLQYDLLDVKNTSWHSDFSAFKHGIKDLDAMTQNVINGAFESVSTVPSAVEMIQAFEKLAIREAIQRCVEKRTLEVFHLFKSTLTSLRIVFEKKKHAPPLTLTEPPFAGAALWARSLLLRATDDLTRLEALVHPLNTVEWHECQSAYDSFRLILHEYIQRKYTDWIEELTTIGITTIASRLEIPLLIKTGVSVDSKAASTVSSLEKTRLERGKKGLLHCNFDRPLLHLFTEVQYWQYFNGEFQIPYLVQDICTHKEKLRILREHVQLVVRDYNRIVVALSSTERRLFDAILRKLDRRILPGLEKLTWTSKGIVEWFVVECRNHCDLTYTIVHEFQQHEAIVKTKCDFIASLMHISIERNTVYDDGVFEEKQRRHRKAMVQQLQGAYETIRATLAATFEHFASGSMDIQREWKRFIERLDKRLEEALRQSVKRSLQEFAKAINGDLKTDPRPLFRLHVVLEENNKVELKPLMAELTQMVNSVAKETFQVIAVVPRLVDSLTSHQKTKEIEGEVSNDVQVQATNDHDELQAITETRALEHTFYHSIVNDEDILKILAQILNGMSSSAAELHKYIGYWDKYKLVWNQDKQAFIRRYAKANRPLQQFRADIERYHEQQVSIQNEDPTNSINFIEIDTTGLKASLMEHTIQWIGKLTDLLNHMARDELREIKTTMKRDIHTLELEPVTLEQLQASLDLLQDMKATMPRLVARFEPLQQKYELLAEVDAMASEEEQRDVLNLKTEWEAYENVVVAAETRLQKRKLSMKQSVQDALVDLTRLMTDLQTEAASTLPYASDQASDVAHRVLAEFEQKVDAARAREQALKTGVTMFELSEAPHEGFQHTEKELNLLQQIWTLRDEWTRVWTLWKTQVFDAIQVETMAATTAHFRHQLVAFGSEMKTWSVWSVLKTQVDQFEQTLPLIHDLKSRALRPRHWAQLKDEMEQTFETDAPTFTLERILALGFHSHAEFITTLSSNAGKEEAIEETLDAIEQRWMSLELDLATYKGVYSKLRSTDDLFTALEDDQVQLTTMKASPFCEPFRTRITSWERALAHVSDVIETLVIVQRCWMYLERIFLVSDDIRKQLPLESQLFDDVHVVFCRIMTSMAKRNNALQATRDPGVLETLEAMQGKLEAIQKGLDQYLEIKRMLFPRFYFLSNDDLLELLGYQKDPQHVEKHLKKCFEAIQTLAWRQVDAAPAAGRGNATIEALGMTSPCGEHVPFRTPVVVAGAVEGWLQGIEAAMIATLEMLLGTCLLGYKGSKKEKWIKDFPGQLILTCGQIVWTNECIKALEQVGHGEKKALKQVKKKWMTLLTKLATLVRGMLSTMERKKLVALITMEIHARDVLERLSKQNCTSVDDFNWLMQLRFYWNKDMGAAGQCQVKQTITLLPYSYEYQGNNGRLVITPLTDRCVLTMTTALHLNRGGNPLGPAGTGKTETVKDLGKNLAKYVLVFNCSDGLDYKSMGRLFAGLVQSGSWGCFDEFNRIEIEVLSVVAQQILTILQALATREPHVMFQGSLMHLKATMGIFITMNPGYAGRTELPDNLKALMRPCAMMVPDLALITEVMLQSEGFYEAKTLAKKITTLYGLMSQQLSKQDHYDFGLRNFKAVLTMAATLKRQEPTVAEETIVCRALRDMNVPKFVPQDATLFGLLLNDLFPSMELVETHDSVLKDKIELALRTASLQLHPAIVVKTMQLEASQVTRHCNMLVGQSMAGKTTTWTTLQMAKTLLAMDKVPGYVPVRVQVLNPKAFSLSELYGVYDLGTFEWIDGILGASFRLLAGGSKEKGEKEDEEEEKEEEEKEEQWLVLDGPVDPLWIESMNSVMDDNKVLTLINGERISLTASMALVFEVQDLAVASPATVSRAGMIYLDVEELGWRPFVQTWLTTTIPSETERQLLETLLEKYIDKLLHFKSMYVTEIVPLTPCNSVQSFCNLYHALAPRQLEDMTMQQPLIVEKWALFCLTWTVMAAATDQGRKTLHRFLRDMDAVLPPQKTAYDVYIDPLSNEFKLWEDQLPSNVRIPLTTPFHQIMVPTSDTLRYGFLLQTLLRAGIPTLLVGDVGIGKTMLIERELEMLSESSSFNVLVLPFSSVTSSATTQERIQQNMEKRSWNKWGPLGGKKLVTFIDDVNLPLKDPFGSQPPLELLRQWMDHHYVYDRKKQTRQYLVDMQLIGAMGPPGRGRAVLCARFQSRFHVIHLTTPEHAQLKRIFETILVPHFGDMDDEIKRLGGPLITATIRLYQHVLDQFLPTPAKCHYLFTLRDIARVMQGLLRADKSTVSGKDAILRLWLHECLRVFADRLTSLDDRQTCQTVLDELLSVFFQTEWHRLVPDRFKTSGPVFTSIASTKHEAYVEVTDLKRLKALVEQQLEHYNAEPSIVPMNLVLFTDALLHILRIHRQLVTPRGHVVLVGVGGSGRQSLTKLAAFLAHLRVFQVEGGTSYRHSDFYDDLKKLYVQVGIEQTPTVFLVLEQHLASDVFVEDVCHLIRSGEIPGLFDKDEQTAVLERMRRPDSLNETNDSLWTLFLTHVRQHLHIVVALSPIGTSFRTRCRAFPSLVTHTSLDWFHPWPVEALEEVGMKFLEEKNVLSELERPHVAAVFATVHSSVLIASSHLWTRQKRFNYVTPTNFLALVAGYVELLADKTTRIWLSRDKLEKGLAKLEEARVQVETMSKHVAERQQVVAVANQSCSDLLVVIVAERQRADAQRQEVEAESERIAKEEQAMKHSADEAQQDLDEALPALQRAMQEVENLDKKAIAEVKVYTQPPDAVAMVMCAVMILFGLPPTWASAKIKMNDVGFLYQIKTFDKDGIREKTVNALKKYTSKPAFNAELVKKVSSAAGVLCAWVLAMESYATVYRLVAPKKDVVVKSQEALRRKQAALELAKDQFNQVTRTIETLKHQYDTSVAEKNALREEADVLARQLVRAQELVHGLEGERERWNTSSIDKSRHLENVVGDALIAAAMLSYAGPFDALDRCALVTTWRRHVMHEQLPLSPTLTLMDFIADPVDIRRWHGFGLPRDAYSIENGVIVTRGKRWPLMIDPQGQANKWIKAMEGQQLEIVDPVMKDRMRKLETAIRFGLPVLLQNVQEALEPQLEPILTKSLVKSGHRDVLKLGDKEVDYNRAFRLYLTTKLPNPHYPPEVSTKTTIVNFVVKEQGLEAQLLGLTVQLEEPTLEEQKADLVERVAMATTKLVELEDAILRLLSTATGSLLDDQELVTTLQASKTIAEDVAKQLESTQETASKIDAARMAYAPVALRSSTLYFVLNDMTSVDFMYQFSLEAYVTLFQDSIRQSRRFESKNHELSARIDAINAYHTYAVYVYACRGLFERHKLLFSLQMCVRILESVHKLPRDEYDFLLKGGNGVEEEEKKEKKNNTLLFLSNEAWTSLLELETLSAFQGLVHSFEEQTESWKTWYQSPTPEMEALPGDWETRCNELQRLVLLRCVRPDRLCVQAARFTAAQLGTQFLTPPPFDLKASYDISSYKTPLLFVLSPGVDPMPALENLASSLHQTIETCALGQGQAKLAEALLARGLEAGSWIVLANCHLMLSWASTLETLIESFCNAPAAASIPSRFRLWLTSQPSPKFPLAILQRSIKMTTEPPRGLKANLLRLYRSLPVDKDVSTTSFRYQRLVFCLCWFHAVVLERRKFSHFGWNVPYEFPDSDFAISHDVLVTYLDQYHETPWEALKYLIAHVNYGGRVTDEWDRRLLHVYMAQFFSEHVLTVDKMPLSMDSDVYYVPPDGDLASYVEYIEHLPLEDPPAAFGQHPNAQIASQIQDGRELLASMVSLQALDGNEEGEKSGEGLQVSNFLDLLKETTAKSFDLQSIQATLHARNDPEPLKIVLMQELKRYNVLFSTIQTSVQALSKSMQGLVVLTPELDAIALALRRGMVPSAWSFCYPSLKPLGSWIHDLIHRCDQMEHWASHNPPAVFWLAGFTYPGGFLTALLQTTARKNGIPIDALKWEFVVLPGSETLLSSGPKDGAYIQGLFLEGARWDVDHECLVDPNPMELSSPMPIVHFHPVEAKKKMSKGVYSCPLYMYPLRTGTPERPSFILAVELKVGAGKPPDVWIRRGTALLLSLST